MRIKGKGLLSALVVLPLLAVGGWLAAFTTPAASADGNKPDTKKACCMASQKTEAKTDKNADAKGCCCCMGSKACCPMMAGSKEKPKSEEKPKAKAKSEEKSK